MGSITPPLMQQQQQIRAAGEHHHRASSLNNPVEEEEKAAWASADGEQKKNVVNVFSPRWGKQLCCVLLPFPVCLVLSDLPA
jgi:hypothetical protein